MRTPEDNVLRLLLVVISIAFLWILRPFAGALLWGVVFAIVFAPVYRRLERGLRGRGVLAALITELIIVVLLIVPLIFVAMALTGEVKGLYQGILSGALSPSRHLETLYEVAPPWVLDLLEHFGLSSLGETQARTSAALIRASQIIAPRILGLGHTVLSFGLALFVMLYVLFFLLREGTALAAHIGEALPMRQARVDALFGRFAAVVRATVKSNLAIAVLQGAFGALIFMLLGIRSPVLWGMLMAVLSLLPLVGAILVWLPAALYLMLSGAAWQGVILVVYGVLVIGLVDNVVRPLMVGKDARMPDYVVLLSTLGGISVFGANGFIIGPLIAALFIATWDIFASDARERERA
jgi:predicted PurR-regulated permease PerM